MSDVAAPGEDAVHTGAGGRSRVLLFTSHLGSGGAERHLARVASHLDPSTFDVTVAVARGGGAYESSLPRHASLVPLTRGIESSSVSMVGAAWPLRRLIRLTRPQVVWAVLDHASICAAAATAGLRRPPALVVSVQNPPLEKYGRTSRLRRELMLRGIARAYARADRVVALASGVADEVRAMCPAVAHKTTFIYNAGFDDSVLAASLEPSELPERRGPVVVACGRLTEQKAYPDLLRAFRIVTRELGAELWILGEGPLRSELEHLAGRLGIAPRVRFLGFRANPFPFIRAADLFVLSSVFEGFGNVITEAMALGVPVVATDCPTGPGEILAGGRAGVLVPPSTPAALGKALVDTLRSPELRADLAERGRQRAADFHATRVADAFGALFRELATGRQGRR